VNLILLLKNVFLEEPWGRTLRSHKDPIMDKHVLYKTLMCKHKLNRRKCPYGKDCNFAHSVEEMRKTTMCHFLPQRSRKCTCRFAHSASELCGYRKSTGTRILDLEPVGTATLCKMYQSNVRRWGTDVDAWPATGYNWTEWKASTGGIRLTGATHQHIQLVITDGPKSQ